MISIYLSIKSDAKNYLTQKRQAQLSYSSDSTPSAENTTDTFIQSALSQTENPTPAIAAREDFPTVDKRQMLKVEIAGRCAIQDLVEIDPLIEGEEIEEDFFSYLSEPFGDLPAHTGVLRRTTNMAQILYLFEWVRIENGNLVHLAPPPPHIPSGPPVVLKLSFNITGKVIKGLLKKAGAKAGEAALSKVGAIVLNLVMKELGMENDTEQMLTEIRKVIKEEIETNEITKIEGTINGTLQFLTVEYKNQKARADLSKTDSRKALLADLKSYSNKFYTEVLGTLKQDKYTLRGMKTFLTAAPIHLLITQEMALVDPDYMDPNQSGYLQTLRDNASIYRSHIKNAYEKAMSDRDNMEVYSKVFVDTMGNSSVRKTTWWWIDNVSGERGGQFMDSKEPKRSAQQNAYDSLERHRKEVLKNRRESLGNPQENFLDFIGDLQNFSFPGA